MYSDERLYGVVVNHEGQYSIWPADRDNPRGWRGMGEVGTRDDCLANIGCMWTDMRPLSLRMQTAREPDPGRAGSQG
jgi:MbtH protein